MRCGARQPWEPRLLMRSRFLAFCSCCCSQWLFQVSRAHTLLPATAPFVAARKATKMYIDGSPKSGDVFFLTTHFPQCCGMTPRWKPLSGRGRGDCLTIHPPAISPRDGEKSALVERQPPPAQSVELNKKKRSRRSGVPCLDCWLVLANHKATRGLRAKPILFFVLYTN